MKNSILNYLVIAAMIILAVFSGCKKEETGGNSGNTSENFVIEATNVIGDDDSKVATVKLDGDEIVVSAPYQNHGFKLIMPKTIEPKVLYPIKENSKMFYSYDESSRFDKLNINNRDAKMYEKWYMCAYDSHDNLIGHIVFWMYENSEETNYPDGFVLWFYLDSDVTIQGTTNEQETVTSAVVYYNGELYQNIPYTRNDIHIYDLNLKKGWNVVYTFDKGDVSCDGSKYTTTNTTTFTTQKPTNMTYKWEYSEGSDWKKTINNVQTGRAPSPQNIQIYDISGRVVQTQLIASLNN